MALITKTLTGALLLGAGSAYAGGIERSTQSMSVLFEKGNYAELSFGAINPHVSGVGSAFSPTPGGASGNMVESYFTLGFAYKHDFGNGLSAAIIYDQPFGADVAYPAAPYYATGTVAELNTNAITGVVKYTMPSNFSVYGGLRYQTFAAEASIPFVGGYTAIAESDAGVGYLAGIAYEKPEIALRVALTYNSEIQHDLATTEFGALTSTTTTRTPQSVNLEFQTGVAPGTLVFGSIRWVDWSSFVLDPAFYPPASPLVSYADDTISYSLGVGRKFNENWSAAVTLGLEKPIGGFSSNLGPTDGYKSISLGATYTKDNVKITAGVRYVDIGDASPTLGGGVPSASFTGNHATAFGIRVGYSF